LVHFVSLKIQMPVTIRANTTPVPLNPNINPEKRGTMDQPPPKIEKAKSKDFVVKKCSKRYKKKLTGKSEEERALYCENLAKQLGDPNWISQQLFDIKEDLVIKLLLIPVAPSLLAHVTKITGSSYGYLHTGIQINNKVVDWDLSGLIVPRTFSSDVHAALDITSAATHSVQKTPELVAKATQLIVKWNNTHEYSTLFRNCQHFVNALLEEINIQLHWNESIASYLHEIKENPKNVAPHIEYKLNGKMERKEFTTHEDLDTFIHDLRRNDGDQYSEIKNLLKAFDRGFWFRDRAKLGSEFKPPRKCPYDLPTCYEVEFSQYL